MTAARVRLVMVEDHPLYRDGLRSALDALEDVEVVGECSDAASVAGMVARSQPDVVLMDLGLGEESGVELTAQLSQSHPEVAVLVLTMDDDASSVFQAIRAGARGYLLKGVDRIELASAVRQVADGEAVFGPGVARRMLAGLAGSSSREPPRKDRKHREDTVLTHRERDTLELMAQGWGNREIAERLFLSPKTVRNNVSAIVGKLHAASRGEVVVRARRWGYGEPPPGEP